jgi:ABC-2 type transport system ATP-binding protein
MIEAKNLTKKFGNFIAVNDLTFNVKEGEIFGFLGPNGAGKTTTVRMLAGLISISSGEVKIDGLDISDAKNSLKIRKMIGLVPDNVGLYEELTAWENLDFFAKLYEVPRKLIAGKIEYYLKKFDLWEQKDEAVGGFSKGMKQKVALSRALLHDPKILFMDEPTANLDPEASKMVRELILQLKTEGKTIFLNTHNLDEAQRICDRIGILKTRLLAINTPADLRKSARGSKTDVELEKITDKILSAVKKAGFTLKVEANKIIADIADSAKENPKLVKTIVDAGGNIQSVTGQNPDLEEAYLKIVDATDMEKK